MKLTDLYDMLVDLGYPVAYRQFKTTTPLPYIVYYFDGDDDLHADDTNHVPLSNVEVELYTEAKDEATEASLEVALADNGFVWTKEETYIDEEHMLQVSYSIQLLGGNDGS